MKIALSVDGRSYAGSAVEIVEKLRRDDIFTKTSTLDEYITVMVNRFWNDGWSEPEIEATTLEDRCAALLAVLVRCGLVQLIASKENMA